MWLVRWVARSEHTGDDSEGHGRAAGLQFQGCQEALRGRCIVALSLEDLAQPIPDLMGCRIHLHCIPENLLSETVAAQLVKDQGLQRQTVRHSRNEAPALGTQALANS